MTQLKMSVADFLSGYGLMHDDTTATDRQTAVIVALPRAMDSVRLVGDEEKHATLLFFGETSSLPEEAKTTLVNTLEQASQMFSPFSEMINDVSRLGSDTPPALVAKLSGRNLSQIRDVLQINPKFGEYMANAPQHPQYTPHVTLGYPDYQGESAIRDSVRQIYRIQFDRLALWWNDERIEFPLGVNLDSNSEGDLMMSESGAKAYMDHVGMGGESLAHHGVKGMKWGQRKDTKTGGATQVKSGITSGNYGGVGKGSGKKPGVVSGNDSLGLSGGSLRLGSYRAGDHTKSRVKGTGLNLLGPMGSAFVAPVASHWASVKPIVDTKLKPLNQKYANMAIDSKLKAKYDAEVKSLVESTFANTKVKGLILPSASAKITSKRVGDIKNAKYEYFTNGKTAFVRISTNKNAADLRVGNFKAPKVVKHADAGGELVFDVPVVLDQDASGFIRSISIPALEAMEHDAMDVVEAFLAHHGIKGMKWGIRRDLSSGGGGGSKAQAKAAKTDAKVEKKAAASTRASLASMKSGSVVTMLDGDGNPKTMVKKKDGSWQETFLSADAERMVRTAQKEGHELSTREVQDALNRANAINNYEKIFGNDPNAQLRQQVDAMRLQKEFAQMKAEMTPQKKSAVSKLVGATSTAFSAYSQLDKAVGGSLSKQLGAKLTEKLDPAGFATSVAKSALKDQNESTLSTAKVQKAQAEARRALAEAVASERGPSPHTAQKEAASAAKAAADAWKADTEARQAVLNLRQSELKFFDRNKTP